MVFQPVINELKTKYKKKITVEKVTISITLNSNDNKIGQVLSVGAKPCVSNVVPAQGSVLIEGKICSKIVLVNSQGDFFSLEGTTNFNQHIMNAGINSDTSVFATASLLDIGNIQATDSAVSFSASILIEVLGLNEQSIKYVQSVNELAHQRMGDIQYTDIISTTTQEFETLNEVELPNNIGSVVQVESDVLLTDVDVDKDVVTLNGHISANLIYTTNEDKPRLKNHRYNIEFSQEVLVTGVESGHMALATLEDCCTTYEVQGELNSTKGVLQIKNQLRTNIFVYAPKVFSAVVDVFCPRHELHSSTSSFIVQQHKDKQVYNEKIDGNIVLSNEDARIDRILATASNSIVSNAINENNILTLEGTMYTNVIYQLEDDEGTIGSVLAEIPFNLSLRTDESLAENDLYSLKIIVNDIEARNKRSREIDIIADVVISIETNSDNNSAVLSDITLGDKRGNENSAIGIYFVNKANDLWDVAKFLLVSPDLIEKQNPGLEFPITKPTKIMIYREKNIN